MKRRSSKKFFNMVEVALALLVISLGLSTVLTLFPAGLKATAEATNDTNVIEAAEYIYAYLQSRNFGTLTSGEPPDGNAIHSKDSRSRIVDVPGGYLYQKRFDDFTEFSCFAWLSTPENGTEYKNPSSSTLVYVPKVKSSDDDSDADATDDDGKLSGRFDKAEADQLNDYIKVFDVELSYPADVTYEKREKRIFRMVFLNGAYDQYKYN